MPSCWVPLFSRASWPFFEYAGEQAWLYCWAVVLIYTLVVQYIAPTWIMPLFNKFKPLEEGDLKSAILACAESIQFPLKRILHHGRLQTIPQIKCFFFTGFGNNKRIVLFDTLILQHTIPELVAVLAHEMGHYKKKAHPSGNAAGNAANRHHVLPAVLHDILPGPV